MNDKIEKYYDKLAVDYDTDRFGNSYGAFIDQEERQFIAQNIVNENSIDIACGSGRFLNFCKTGVDISANMIAVAKRKFPDKLFIKADALRVAPEVKYDSAICFHLLMHLEPPSIHALLENVYELLHPKGLFIFDVAAKERKQLLKKSQADWHGTNSYSMAEIKNACGKKMKIKSVEGVLFLPIHRIPPRFRARLLKLDQMINKTGLKKYSSYRMYVLEKLG